MALIPKLSIVVTARNDNHGGELLKRMQFFLDGIYFQSEQYQLLTEIIIIEWNPPTDKPFLAKVLNFPKQHKFCIVRIITIPNEIHLQYQYSKRLPLFQMLAKNVGIRRAHGEYILVTNIDILFSDELFEFMASNKLVPDKLYRVDRLDINQDIPLNSSHYERLNYCKNNIVRINKREYSIYLETQEKNLIYPEKTQQFHTSIYGKIRALHTNACGDFQLMNRKNWFDLRAYCEAEYFSLHLDSLLSIKAHYGGAKEVLLAQPMCTYHIEHESGWKPETNRLKSFNNKFSKIKSFSSSQLFFINQLTTRTGKIIQFNNSCWGLKNVDFPEVCHPLRIQKPLENKPSDINFLSLKFKINKGINKTKLTLYDLKYKYYYSIIFLRKTWHKFKIRILIENQILKINNKPVAIFGAGIYGRKLYNKLPKKQLNIVCFFDNSPSLIGQEINTIPILKPSENKELFNSIDTILLGSANFVDEMKKELKLVGYMGRII